MRAIIVTDVEVQALLDRLALQKFDASRAWLSGDERRDVEVMTNAIHRRFHYVVSEWIREVSK